MAAVAEEHAEQIRLALDETIAAFDPPEVGEAIGLHCMSAVSQLAARRDPSLEEETILAALSNVVAILEGVASGSSPADAEVAPPTADWASTLVHRGVAAAAIPRCYVAGQAIMEDFSRKTIAATDLPPDLKWDLAGMLSSYLFGYVDKVCGEVVEHYERERDRWVRGADSIRTDLVLAIVEGRPFDATSAGATLRYSLDRPHVALLVAADPRCDEQPNAAALKTAAARVARDLGGRELLVIPAGQSVVWAWTTGDQLRDGLGMPLSVDKGLLGAIGAIGYGVDGFVHSHHEAREAHRMAGLLSRPSGSVVRYRSVALSSLMTRDPAFALRFIQLELGELSADTDACRRLRATLTVYFEEGMSWGRTARRLGVHQNTVIYRVRRAEETLGHPITERRQEVEAALRLADAQDALRAAATPPPPPGAARDVPLVA